MVYCSYIYLTHRNSKKITEKLTFGCKNIYFFLREVGFDIKNIVKPLKTLKN